MKSQGGASSPSGRGQCTFSHGGLSRAERTAGPRSRQRSDASPPGGRGQCTFSHGGLSETVGLRSRRRSDASPPGERRKRALGCGRSSTEKGTVRCWAWQLSGGATPVTMNGPIITQPIKTREHDTAIDQPADPPVLSPSPFGGGCAVHAPWSFRHPAAARARVRASASLAAERPQGRFVQDRDVERLGLREL